MAFHTIKTKKKDSGNFGQILMRHVPAVSATHRLRQLLTEEGNFFGGKHFWVSFLPTVTLRVTNRPHFGTVIVQGRDV